MSVEVKNEVDFNKVVTAAVKQHGHGRDELIPILNQINLEIGYLPGEVLDLLSKEMRVPKSQLLSVASFYQMLSTKKLGRHVVKFCESAPCHVVGGREVWNALEKEIKLESGETTSDGKWSLVTTSCLGVCAVGPVIIVDEDIFGNVTPDQVPQILSRYK